MGTQACPLSQPDTQDTAKQDFEKQSGTDSDSGSSHASPPTLPTPARLNPHPSAESTLIEDQEESSLPPAESARSRADSFAVKASEVAPQYTLPRRDQGSGVKHSPLLGTGAKANPQKSVYVCR